MDMVEVLPAHDHMEVEVALDVDDLFQVAATTQFLFDNKYATPLESLMQALEGPCPGCHVG